MDYLIWWLCQADCESLEDSPLYVEVVEDGRVIDHRIDGLPGYLDTEFWSRQGRPARGRLWVSSALPLPNNFSIDYDAACLGGQKLSFADYGGIVIRAEDKPAVIGLPGILTDTNLRLIGE